MKRFIYFLAMLSSMTAYSQSKTADAALIEKAKGIHERVITLDTHDDINASNFTAATNYTQRLSSQVNLPKMIDGGLDVSWFIVYTAQGDLTKEGYEKAYVNADEKFKAIHRLCEEIAPDKIGLALTSDDVRRIIKSGRKVAMIGVENGYPIGMDITHVKEFYDRGARYMSLAHNGHSQLADSNTGERDSVWLNHGLSPLGKEVIKEMNKWGIMVDLSHPSKESNIQAIRLSRAPVIASHSSARALNDVSRNLDDEQLMLIKEKNGVVQTVAFKSYLNTKKNDAYTAKLTEVAAGIAKTEGFTVLARPAVLALSTADREAYMKKNAEINDKARLIMEKDPSAAKSVDVSDFVDHIDYLVKKIGVDHVGISSDFDGGGGISGWNDASETFNVTLELVKRGYTEKQIGMMWSGNLLRVLDDVQAVAAKIQKEEKSTKK
ncbi:MAG TPA: dipeptidase [Cyclobacteriaceae bacterium]|jgi:membrane dipeptidase|nr:dipeptidase [Cyclobacteriaceae bacterium]